MSAIIFRLLGIEGAYTVGIGGADDLCPSRLMLSGDEFDPLRRASYKSELDRYTKIRGDDVKLRREVGAKKERTEADSQTL